MNIDRRQRDAKRKKIIQFATLITKQQSISCRVVDVSSHGIRLGMSEYLDIPLHVEVKLLDQSTWPAVLCWQRGMQAGFKFSN